ncbi:MAG: hypothetical protein P8X48_04225 [Acidiferrobacteraceae bacterium]
MVESVRQYLRFTIEHRSYLLPSGATLSIEQRESMFLNPDQNAPIVAWHEARGARWPAYGLTAELRQGVAPRWQRAVFLPANPTPVGLVADEIQLIPPQTGIEVMPFSPLGRTPGYAGHLFNGARVDEEPAILLLEPNALVAHLIAMGGTE